jgi:hypothetical protein
VFVREELRLDVSFAAAVAGLGRLTTAGWLLTASQAAYGDGFTGFARVGPVKGLSRLVRVQVGEAVQQGGSARLALRWEVTGTGSALFPALDADIILTPAIEHGTDLALAGVYRPPLRGLGATVDRAVLNRVATATIRDFTGRVAEAILAPAAAAAYGSDCRNQAP